MPTERQKKLIKLLSENLGKRGGEILNLGDLLREAGYSESMARSPAQVFKGSKTIKTVADSFIKRLQDHRSKALARMDKLVDKAGYRDAVDGLDKTTKNIQLLTGGKTENVGFSITKLLEDADKLDE